MGQERRLELQEILVAVLETDHVYFQPPENVKIEYPCIVYERSSILPAFADNRPHFLTSRYSVTAISRDPDDETPDRIAALPKCNYDRYYRADNLHHHVFRLFF